MTVWITGASSGLGLYTAEALRKAGYTVVAGARSFADPARRKDDLCLPLDVTDDASADAFVREALARTGTPDVLINAAGILILGACETYETEELRRVMETNYFGMTRMISRVLPLMRGKGKGRIVNFSSINGLLGIPFEGAYTASKHAIEGYTECLGLEARAHGIEVMLVEPGDHSGGSRSYRSHSRGMTADNPYRRAFEKGTAAIARDEEGGSDPARLGQKVVRLLKRRHLPLRVRIAKPDQRLAVWLHRLLPGWLFEKIISIYYL